MSSYTNKADLPLSVSAWLALDTYVSNAEILSATQLIKPVRKLILEHRLKSGFVPGVVATPADVMNMMKSRKGTAVHESIEAVWTDKSKRDKALLALGYPEKSLDRFVVNVEPEDLKKGDIPIYTERFCERELDGYWFGGTADFIIKGKLEDFKNTSTYSYMDAQKHRAYQIQGSIYRWAQPEVITEDVMEIIEMYDDWSKGKSFQKNYPPAPIVVHKIDLMSIRATETFLRNKINLVNEQAGLPEEEIDLCTDQDLWRKPDVYKYYKNPNSKTRSTGNYDTYEEAQSAFIADNRVGEVVQVKGKAIACNFCDARVICSQYQSLVTRKEIDIKD